MPTETLILRQKVEALLAEYYPDNVHCEVPEFLETANLSSHFLPTSILFVLNFSKQGYEFVSSNISQLFSMSPETLVEEGLHAGLKLFPSSSQEVFVNKLLPEIFFQFEKAGREGLDPKKFKVHYNINMDSPEKGIVNTMHIIKPAVIDENGMPLLALKYIFDISDYSNETDISLTFEYVGEKSTSIYYSTSFKVESHQEISKREAEIIHYIGLGMSSKEIADKLCISIHTVNTHRKNIMKKYNVQNFQQAFYKANS